MDFPSESSKRNPGNTYNAAGTGHRRVEVMQVYYPDNTAKLYHIGDTITPDFLRNYNAGYASTIGTICMTN